MSTAIRFVNDELNVFVIDIPRSLELANGDGRIYSSKALTTPYITPEPKGKKRATFVASLPADHVAFHEGIQKDVRRALQSIISSTYFSEWCLARIESGKAEPLSLCFSSHGGDVDQQDSLPLILSSIQNDFPSQESLSHDIVLNPNTASTLIQVAGQDAFWIPGTCAFVWSSIERALSMLAEYHKAFNLLFDMILMDPPWTNRSVRNGRKYCTAEDQPLDPFDYAIQVVERHRKSTGYVAIWVTNKAAVHKRVLSAMASLRLRPVEEWVWVKVTDQGEPMMPLDGVWRKPYEILLIFRHEVEDAPHLALRRYIFAVPDVHSRKPNLKELFSKVFQTADVLELFARNLTTGWWCIGNEVLNFQHESAWSVWPDSMNKPSSTTEQFL